MPAGELELFHELDTAPDRGQWRSRLASLAIHALALLLLLNIDFTYTPPPPRDLPEITMRRVTPLVAPPPQVVRELTQTAPNTKDVAKEIDLAGLLPKPEVKAPPSKAAAAPRPSPGPPQAPSLPSAPKIEAAPSPVAQLPPMGTGNTNLPPPPAPEPPPQQKPKIMFESVSGSGMAAGNTQGARTPANVQLAVPKGTVDEAVSAVARNRTGGIVVGDNLESGLGQSMSQIPTPGKMGSALELLSDPQGADFRSYLIRVLTAVRRNWFAVIPESARLGQRRGRVVIQFAINKDGAVPKLVIASPSGAEPLDRAAVAGISASNPFPPLPAEFRGDQIRVSLSFVYNQK